MHMPGTPAGEHWLPAQLVTQALVNLLAQTQCAQTVVGSFLNCVGTDLVPSQDGGECSYLEAGHPAIRSLHPSKDGGLDFNKVVSAVSSKVVG